MRWDWKRKSIIYLLVLNIVVTVLGLGWTINVAWSWDALFYGMITIGLSVISIIMMVGNKNKNMLYLVAAIMALGSYFFYNIFNLIINVTLTGLFLMVNSEERKKIKELLTKYPVGSAVVVTIIGVSFLQISGLIGWCTEFIYGTDLLGEFVVVILLGILMGHCWKQGLFLKRSKSLKETFWVTLPIVLYLTLGGVSLFSQSYFADVPLLPVGEIIIIVLLYLCVGIYEDFLVRGLTLNILLDKYGKTKKGIWFSILLSSIIFGVIHFSNLSSGASLFGVTIQVVGAIAIGVYLAAIYMRTGSVWVCALIHGLWDITSSVSDFFVKDVEVIDTGLEYAKEISNYSLVNLIPSLIIFGLALFLLRKEKMRKLVAEANNLEYRPKVEKNFVTFLKQFTAGFLIALTVNSIWILGYDYYLLREKSQDFYQEFLENNIYFQSEELFRSEGLKSDNLKDETKVAWVLGSILKNDVSKTIPINEIKDKMEMYFTSSEVIFEDIELDNNIKCQYENDNYICQRNGLVEEDDKTYINLLNKEFDENGNMILYINFILEERQTKTLYADSNKTIIYKTNTTMEELSDNSDYENDSRVFFENIIYKMDGQIPTYKFVFKFGDDGTVIFDHYEYLDEVIEPEYLNKDKNNYRLYFNNYYLTYNHNLLKVDIANDNLWIRDHDDKYLLIQKVSSKDFLNKYKNNVTKVVQMGNNQYYYYNDGTQDFYMIYHNYFYVISGTMNHADGQKIISSITFID